MGLYYHSKQSTLKGTNFHPIKQANRLIYPMKYVYESINVEQ